MAPTRAAQVKRLLSPLAQRRGRVTIFVDDLHLLQPALQPVLLSSLYAFSRGKSIHLKVSAIENLARIWEQPTSSGLELPNDASAIRLDHNLTMPDKSLAHITKILDAHARFCALPSISYHVSERPEARWIAVSPRTQHWHHSGPSRRRYMALMLDYGLYVSVRRARSMDLFQKTPKTVPYKELRRLPRFESDSLKAQRPSRPRRACPAASPLPCDLCAEG